MLMQSEVFTLYRKCRIMCVKLILVIILLLKSCQCEEVTFKNVTFTAYQQSIEKFKITIINSNVLSEYLPNSGFDKIEAINQYIPFLHRVCLSNLAISVNELVLQNCGIKEFWEGFLESVKLQKISLKGNLLTYVGRFTYDIRPEIRDIDLSFNEINSIDERAFDLLSSLRYINLEHNNLKEWNMAHLTYLPSIRKLNLGHNEIDTLLGNSFPLSYLDFEPQFLTTVILSNNKIKTIEPRAFNGLGQSYNFMLDNNQLETFDGNLLDGVDVLHLSLINNSIRCLDDDLDKVLKAYVNHLELNPLTSNCLNKIKKWTKKNNKYVFWSCSGN